MLSFKILFTWTLKFFSLIYPRLNYDNWFETLKRKFDLFEIIKQKKIISITTRLTWVFTCRCCGIKAVYKALTDDSSSGFSASWRWGRLIVALLDVVGIPSTRKINEYHDSCMQAEEHTCPMLQCLLLSKIVKVTQIIGLLWSGTIFLCIRMTSPLLTMVHSTPSLANQSTFSSRLQMQFHKKLLISSTCSWW